MERLTVDELDPQFTSECPECGKIAAWDGGVASELGHLYLDLACPHCGHRFAEHDPAWQAQFEDGDPPTFQPGPREEREKPS